MKIDMEKRFGPGGTDQQVTDMVKKVAEEVRFGHTGPNLDILEITKKGVRFHEKEKNVRGKS